MLTKPLDSLLGATLAALLLPIGVATGAEQPSMPQDLTGYRFVSALVVNDPESPLFGFHHFYVNETATKPLVKGGPYPPGSVFVGLVYEVSPEGLNIDEGGGVSVTLMEKVEGAKETGGWRFAQFDTTGKRVEIDEKKDCFNCHTQVEDRDYVFSRPLGVGVLSSLEVWSGGDR